MHGRCGPPRHSWRVVRACAFLLWVLCATGCWNPLAPGGESDPAVEPVPFVLEGDPTWSPDGSTVAYCRHLMIRLVGISGADDRTLVQGVSPDWSPRGDRIVFMRDWDIFTIKVDGDSLSRLTWDGTGILPSWSPDGTRIAFTGFASDTQSIWVMGADGGNQTDLHLPGGSSPDWSPDGNRLVFSQWTERSGSQLRVCDLETLTVQNISVPGYFNGDPQWSPTGGAVVFSSDGFEGRGPDDGLPSLQVWIMDSDGGHQRQLTKGSGMDPAWSPDGSRIAYSQENWDGGRLWIMNPDGTGKRPLLAAR
jgi:TolB protein